MEDLKYDDFDDKIKQLLESKASPELISKCLSYYITGKIISEYNYDLEKMLKNKGPVKELIELLSRMIYRYPKIPLTDSIAHNSFNSSFNLMFKNQKGLNPAIDYIYSKVYPFHHNRSVILDLYLDDTFGPNQEVYELLNIVPFVKNWCGFVYSFDVFESKAFRDSLKYCKGLFVFSEELKSKIKDFFIPFVKVTLFHFPVTEPIGYFNGTVDGIITKNSLETVDTFSFYKNNFKLKTGFWFKKERTLKKYNLSFKCRKRGEPPQTESGLSLIDMHRLTSTLSATNWNLGFIRYTNELISSVTEFDICYNLDILLRDHIVFCNFISGSVIWILNECIVRNTPILITKHPVVVELLGSDYPLYIEENATPLYIKENATNIVVTMRQIRKAHRYLKRIDKKKFEVVSFLSKLNKEILKIKN